MPMPHPENAQTTLREFSDPSPRQTSQISHSAITPAIDYRLALAVRRELAGDDSLPRYLLAPEVTVLLGAVPDLHRRMLFEFIWNTGARINEALAVRPDDIVLDSVRPHVRLVTLKRQRNPKPGKPPASAQRRVPLLDAGFVARLRDHLVTFCPNRRRPVWEGRGGKPVTDDTARNWLSGAVAAIARKGISLSLPNPTPHTLRHSYAMHLLYCGIMPAVLQGWLGHADFRNTQIYIRVMHMEAAAAGSRHVSFGMDAAEAAALLGP